jgi:UrcA family protein
MSKANPAFVAIAALAAAGALVVPTVSQANELSSTTISYADLNLASEAGATALQRRINVAARVVCGYEDSKQYDVVMATKVCRTGAVEGARPAYEEAVAAARHGTVTVGAAASLVVTAPGE